MTPDAPTLLLVDDTPDNLDLLSGFLGTDYRLKVATSGARALELAERNPVPELILLDIMMPTMDGYEVCARLKANPATVDIPVIFVTAASEIDDETRGLDLGAVDYLTKPVSPPIVQARIRTHLTLARQRRELARALAELQALEELRDNLVHMIVHDMRSPLMGITGYVQLAQEKLAPDVGEKVARYLDCADRDVQRLLDMVNSLLDISRLEAGKMPLDRQTTDLGQLVSDEVKRYQGLGRPVTLSAPPDLPTLSVDAALVVRVVRNLIDNALKFSPAEGTVQVTVEAREGNHLEVGVIDEGPGIPPGARAHIFSKFGQVRGRKSGAPSSGLGLTFCRLAVAAHGGTIGLDPVEPTGSRFWFQLPVAPP